MNQLKASEDCTTLINFLYVNELNVVKREKNYEHNKLVYNCNELINKNNFYIIKGIDSNELYYELENN